ncbi:MAG: adenylyl-sulfate kinase [Promethearchaeota archaeon]
MVVNKNFLVCLTGLPASGKTTFAIILKKKIEEVFDTNAVKIIDPDIIRQSITPDRFDYKFEPEIRKKNLLEIEKELYNGNTVISDDLNYYTSMRHDLKKLADNFKIYFFIIKISTPVEICLKWNKLRGKPIPNKIIKNTNEKFDDFGKYNWDNPEAIYDVSQIHDLNKEIENLVQRIKNKIKILNESVDKKQYLKDISNLDNQNLDKITRMYVGKLLQNSEFSSMKKKIIKTRKLFIKLYKNRFLKEPDIAISFKDYLEKRLNVLISDKLL